VSWRLLERDGVRLACRDFGGSGAAVLFLHGLAGHADEWAGTAGWLSESRRVLALDARGHGRSERSPHEVSPGAHVADVVFAIESMRIAPVSLVGQSLGGRTAMLVAAERPDLVHGLVVAEASPSADEDAVAEVQASLARWPRPFGSREEAVEFFGESRSAEAWADGLERREDGWWPRFDTEVIVRTLREAVADSLWAEWKRISCPVLVVRGSEGDMAAADAHAMVARLPAARLVEIAGAGHDVHLDRPAEWRAALEEFLGRPV
jgi:pimeloyl-ACP methyl ester carboxylesterase